MLTTPATITELLKNLNKLIMILLYKNKPTINEKQKTVVLNGTNLPSLTSLYNYLKTELSLPDYFGDNLDALADSLTDLGHLGVDEVVLIIENQEAFLNAETEENKTATIETLVFSVDEVDLLKEEDENYDTPFVFLYLENNKNNLSFLNEEGIPFEEI
jgi:RNAse (barnase) inhibitor barstar